ncbi:MAG: hypothetical protein J7M05_14095 [Anaerolineae bacterium]|nr:hypothetical protein [Anaerolineae bacterium]
MMREIRTAIGVALAVSLFIILTLGFFATSSRDLVLVFFGFASGLLAVYLLERLRPARSRREQHS